MDQKTIGTYDQSARELAAKFDEIGVRVSDILETFQLVKKPNPKVLEVGCGNGRDAQEILKYTDDYLGIDASEQMIALAKEKIPRGNFKVADMEEFEFPVNLDIVFAFASFLHVSKENLKEIFHKILVALNKGGAMRISLKHREKYVKVVKEDEFGSRIFYFYSQEDIKELARGFVIIKNELYQRKNTVWLEVLLQKA